MGKYTNTAIGINLIILGLFFLIMYGISSSIIAVACLSPFIIQSICSQASLYVLIFLGLGLLEVCLGFICIFDKEGSNS